MVNTIYSLIPPLLVIGAVLLTKKVLLSISLGIISCALIIHSFLPLESAQAIVQSFVHIFYDNGLNWGNIHLILFLFLLGVLTSFISRMGGTRAFASWAKQHVKNDKQAQFVSFFLGIIIFIDDYFNALTVGQIARPLTDKFKVSREKLAYLIDSTSAPVCVLSPISSWGAYIIALLSGIMAANQIEGAPFTVFVKMIPFNFYALLSLGMVICAIIFRINIGKMNEVKDYEEEIVHEEVVGEAKDLIQPIALLVIITLGMMFYTGYLGAGSFNPIAVLENSNTYLSLFTAACISLIFIMIRYFKKGYKNIASPWMEGIKSMRGAVLILCFAWALIELISLVGTGTYLSELFISIQFDSAFLPVILFIISGFMALATGTSWGTFGVMLPIGAQMAMHMDPSILYLCLGAVLSGSVFGDHCSPISDTTILSSTGAKCNHIDHVTTQLPYALFTAGVSAIGFLTAGMYHNLFITACAVIISFILSVFILKTISNRQK